MDQNIRIAVQLRHKDDSLSNNTNELAFGDYEWGERRYLRLANGSNEWLLFKDIDTDYIKDTINDIFVSGNGNNATVDPSIIFLYQFDENNNPTYSDKVIDKWKQFMRSNNPKPYIWNIYDNGTHSQVIPIFPEKMVFTTVRLDNEPSDYKDIGKLTEELINKFINIENNLSFRVVKMYDKCMKIAHELHLIDINQDATLTRIWGDLITAGGTVEQINDWLVNVNSFQNLPVKYTIDLKTSDNNYLYKYVIENGANNSGYTSPVEYTSITCENTKPHGMADLVHTKDGILMESYIRKSERTDYTRRDVLPYSSWSNSSSANFQSNPLVPVVAETTMIGDNDNQINLITGTVTTAFKTDVPDMAFDKMPWLQVYADCYDLNSKQKVKTINGVFETSGSNQLNLSNRGMLSGTYKFTVNPAGYYAVKIYVKVFWGTFNSWSDEVEIAYFWLARGDNSGGTFNINDYLFDGKKNRVLTRYWLENTSKYEWWTGVDGVHYSPSATFPKPIKYEDHKKFEIPWSANWHGTHWYGHFINKDEPVQRVSWDNLRRTGAVDMSSSMHYWNEAHNLGILTSIKVSVNYSGQKAYYNPDTYNTPAIFNPVTKDCTIMLRGGNTYNLMSYCQNLRTRQIGVYKVDVGTIGAQLLNTLYLGYDSVHSQNVIIRGQKGYYNLDVTGREPSITLLGSGVPMSSENKERRRRTRSIDNKPQQEHGLGYVTTINLEREYALLENPNNVMTIKTKDNKSIKFRMPIIVQDGWNKIYSNAEDSIRVYGKVEGIYLQVMTYYIDVDSIYISTEIGNTLELIIRDKDNGEVVTSYELKNEMPDKYIPVEINGQQYYIEVSDDKNEYNDVNVVLEDDMTSELIGYLK